ncbi:hypothetical protein Q604_UNBC08992G0001, partial [human gut metagenome]
LLVFQFDVDTQRTNLFQQYVEGFWHARLHLMVAVHDVFIHLGTTVHVIRLNGEHFLRVYAAPYASSAHTSISPKR